MLEEDEFLTSAVVRNWAAGRVTVVPGSSLYRVALKCEISC